MSKTRRLSAAWPSGTTFANHHCVYLSSTEVNGTALATGDYPQHTGIVANDEYHPEIRPLEPIAMQSDEAVRDGDKAAHGAYIAAPTMAEILQRTGRWTVVAGSKPVTLLLDRHERSDGAGVSGLLYEGKARPASSTHCSSKPAESFPTRRIRPPTRIAWPTLGRLKPSRTRCGPTECQP